MRLWLALHFDKWDGGEGGLHEITTTAEKARELCEADAAGDGRLLGEWRESRLVFGSHEGQLRYVAEVLDESTFQWYSVESRDVEP